MQELCHLLLPYFVSWTVCSDPCASVQAHGMQPRIFFSVFSACCCFCMWRLFRLRTIKSICLCAVYMCLFALNCAAEYFIQFCIYIYRYMQWHGMYASNSIVIFCLMQPATALLPPLGYKKMFIRLPSSTNILFIHINIAQLRIIQQPGNSQNAPCAHPFQPQCPANPTIE